MSRIAYFECREDNHNKFYLMTEDPTGTTFVARWGRIGTEGTRNFMNVLVTATWIGHGIISMEKSKTRPYGRE